LKIDAPLAAADVRKPDRSESREGAGVEASPSRVGLDDISYGSVSQSSRGHRAGFVDWTEDRSSLDTGCIQPLSQSTGMAGGVTPGYGSGDSLAFLVGLAAPDRYQQAGFCFRDIGAVER
jgi:hypothetical protein